jgi:hypothetical protein
MMTLSVESYRKDIMRDCGNGLATKLFEREAAPNLISSPIFTFTRVGNGACESC